ncbi:MAG TPA: hypothetical protein VL987_12195 [Cellvibrio sp.]|nr:hypothetical protein [Cellvibrio sp.]
MTTADVATISGSVDYATIIVGIAAIAAAAAIVYVAVKGGKMLLGMVKGA